MIQKGRWFIVLMSIGCMGILLFSGCAWFPHMGGGTPEYPGPGTAPTLSALSVSPNPANPGSIVNLSASYVDPDADLQYGVAAVTVNGENLSRIAFRSTYVSGVLTIPLPISQYSRWSTVQLTLRIRDTSGNWSNAVATTLTIQ
jgi:hypothetical protein